MTVDRVARAVEALVEELNIQGNRAEIRHKPTTALERQRLAVEEVIAAYTDGHDELHLRAATDVYGNGVVLFPILGIRQMAWAELTGDDPVTVYDVTEEGLGVLTDEEVRDVVREAVAVPLRQAVRAKLRAEGIKVKPWVDELQ
jgi:hypothetical protein